jgi:hypothetical protein
MSTPQMGVSGRIAALFQSAYITPLLALVALLLGIFAVLVTPREEEPQINVTMANVIAPFPGASVRDVEQMVAIPGEQVLSKIVGVEHVMSVSRPGVAVLTVQFKVGHELKPWCDCTTPFAKTLTGCREISVCSTPSSNPKASMMCPSSRSRCTAREPTRAVTILSASLTALNLISSVCQALGMW